MRGKRIIFFVIALVVMVTAGFAYYQYNRPQEDVRSLKPVVATADGLFKAFSTDEQSANKSYLNKAVQVTGKVMEVKENQNRQMQLILDAGDPFFGIACTLDNAEKQVKAGDEVTVKGICTGYLNDVILIRSLVLN